MTKKFEIHYPPGATPLEPEELEGLIPRYITTHGELNELEHQNIQQAFLWVRKKQAVAVTDINFLYELHRQMFHQVWKWAGCARKTGKNIGIDWQQISTQTAQLLGDTKYWLANNTFPLDEIAVRFHHRLVQIHIFPNGNGRHARLMTDLLLELGGQPPFSWGEKAGPTPIEVEGTRRHDYIAALRAADKNDYACLIAFVRS
jgi:Fic-DOC domain mobile mystery protein B